MRFVAVPAEELQPGVAAAAEVAPPASLTPSAAPVCFDTRRVRLRRRAAPGRVLAKITGKVAAVLIEEGQRVEASEVIARLDDANVRAQVAQAAAQVEQQRANLAAAQVAFDNARPMYERHRAQFAAAFISAQTFDDAKASYDTAQASLSVASRALDVAEASLAVAQQNLDDTVVRAPFGGIVTVKAAQRARWSRLAAGGGFTRPVSAPSSTWIPSRWKSSERELHRPRRNGRPRHDTLNAYPERPPAGPLIAVIPTADRAKATVKVRIGFEHRDAGVLPEMGARVSFLGEDSGEGHSHMASIVSMTGIVKAISAGSRAWRCCAIDLTVARASSSR